MNLNHFQQNCSILYDMNHYPLFLLDEGFHIQCSPASFLSLPTDFFCNYKQQVQQMSKPQQTFYMLYEHGYFYSIILLQEECPQYIWIGPILLNEMKIKTGEKSNDFVEKAQMYAPLDQIIQKLPILQEDFVFFIQLLYQNILHTSISSEHLALAFRQEMRVQTESRLQLLQSKKRELDNRDYNYGEEVKLLYYIRQGDAVSARIIASNLAIGRLGQLSKDTRKIPLYAFISLTTIISRTSVDCGVDIETAYGLHDLYIQRADETTSPHELRKIWMDMIVDFCLLIKQTTKKEYPTWVHQCLDFIKLNLHQVITLEMLGNHVHMLPSYISVQFKKITNENLITCIQRKKIEEAAFLLRSTTDSILEISTLLGFSSQAYFSTIFRKQMHVSPTTYRNNPFDGTILNT